MNNITGKCRRKLIEKVKSKSKKMVFAVGSSFMFASCVLGGGNRKGKKQETSIQGLQDNNGISNLKNTSITSPDKTKTDASGNNTLKDYTNKSCIITPLLEVDRAKINMQLLLDNLELKKESEIDEEEIYTDVKRVLNSFKNSHYLFNVHSDDLMKLEFLWNDIQRLLRKAPKGVLKRLKKEYEDDATKDIKRLEKKCFLSIIWKIVFIPLGITSLLLCTVYGLAPLLGMTIAGSAFSFLMGYGVIVPLCFFIGFSSFFSIGWYLNPFYNKKNNHYKRKKMKVERNQMGIILKKVYKEKDKDKDYNYKDWVKDLKSLGKNHKFEYET